MEHLHPAGPDLLKGVRGLSGPAVSAAVEIMAAFFRQERAVRAKCALDLDGDRMAHPGGLEHLLPGEHHLHRTAGLLRQLAAAGLMGEHVQLAAEASSYPGLDHPHLPLRDP